MIVEADNSFDSPDAQPPNLVGHYAGFASRAIALIIDYLIILLLLYIIVWFINSIPDMCNVQSLNLSWLNSLVILISSTIFTIAFIYGYFSIFWFLTGQTLVNAVMGIFSWQVANGCPFIGIALGSGAINGGQGAGCMESWWTPKTGRPTTG